MANADPDKLADLVAALIEFIDRLGLAASDKAALRAELDAIRAETLYRPGVSDDVAARLRRARDILGAGGDNRLAQGAISEIGDLLGEQ